MQAKAYPRAVAVVRGLYDSEAQAERCKKSVWTALAADAACVEEGWRVEWGGVNPRTAQTRSERWHAIVAGAFPGGAATDKVAERARQNRERGGTREPTAGGKAAQAKAFPTVVPSAAGCSAADWSPPSTSPAVGASFVVATGEAPLAVCKVGCSRGPTPGGRSGAACSPAARFVEVVSAGTAVGTAFSASRPEASPASSATMIGIGLPPAAGGAERTPAVSGASREGTVAAAAVATSDPKPRRGAQQAGSTAKPAVQDTDDVAKLLFCLDSFCIGEDCYAAHDCPSPRAPGPGPAHKLPFAALGDDGGSVDFSIR